MYKFESLIRFSRVTDCKSVIITHPLAVILFVSLTKSPNLKFE